MQFVDYDPAAAATAATACREAADDLRAAAAQLEDSLGEHLSAWAGASRVEFDDAAADIAQDLRGEAEALETTADAIDRATASARRAENGRRIAHEREQAQRRELERERQRNLPVGAR